MTELLAGIAYFVFVFFKAAQQRNVAFMHYKWVMLTSYCMSTTEVIVNSMIAVKAVIVFTSGGSMLESMLEMVPMILTIGTGGGLGAMLAMYLHNRYIK